MTSLIEYVVDGDIAVLTLRAPPVNALGRALRSAIVECVARAEAASGVRAVVVLGSEKLFSAGADITEFGKPLVPPSLGPFAMRDLAGLDVGWTRETSTSSTVRDVLAEMGRLGQKAGAGFYDYDDNRAASRSAVTEQAILDFSKRAGIERRAISDEEIVERCLYPMVNEGAKILQEGKAIRASDIDVVWLNGYGWPRYRGGPMFWASQVGLPKIVEALRRYDASGKADFKPAALLERLAAKGDGFSAI